MPRRLAAEPPSFRRSGIQYLQMRPPKAGPADNASTVLGPFRSVASDAGLCSWHGIDARTPYARRGRFVEGDSRGAAGAAQQADSPAHAGGAPAGHCHRRGFGAAAAMVKSCAASGSGVRNAPESRDKYDEPLVIFRKRSIAAWAAVAAVTFAALAGAHALDRQPESGPPERDAAIGMLHTNAEILATILAVTLGVTLLGLQLRSQSYTMVGLIEYINDKVIIGFIGAFVAGIMFSMASTLGLSPLDPAWAAAYALTGTFFLLCYHAGYTYHVIYKLQFSQMLADTSRKMALHAREDPVDRRPFVIWQGIMKRVVDTGDQRTFQLGMEGVLLMFGDFARRSPGKSRPGHHEDVMSAIRESSLSVMKYSTLGGDQMGSAEFMAVLDGQRDAEIPAELRDHELDVLKLVMARAAADDDGVVFGRGILHMMDLAKTGDEATISASNFVSDLINSCADRNRRGVLHAFMQMSGDGATLARGSDGESGTYWRIALWEIFRNILHRAVRDNDATTFSIFMDAKTRALDKILGGDYGDHEKSRIAELDSVIISDSVKYAIARDHYAVIRMFIGAVRRMADDGYMARWLRLGGSGGPSYLKRISDTMMLCAYETIGSGDRDLFEGAVTPIILEKMCQKLAGKGDESAGTIARIRENIARRCAKADRDLFVETLDKIVRTGRLAEGPRDG